MATNYRILSNAELVRAAESDPLIFVHPLFAELAARLRPDAPRDYERGKVALAPVVEASHVRD